MQDATLNEDGHTRQRWFGVVIVLFFFGSPQHVCEKGASRRSSNICGTLVACGILRHICGEYVSGGGTEGLQRRQSTLAADPEL